MSENKHSGWSNAWDNNNIGWHEKDVNPALRKYSSSFFQDGKNLKVFVPLCGKTVDMKWFADLGYSVVGLDCVKKAVEDFCKEHDYQWTEEAETELGAEGCVMKVKDANIRLYLGDMFQFNQSLEGQYDCVWDRGSLVALDRKDINKYVKIIKDILKPGGRTMVETYEYDVAIFGENPKHPPPFPMVEEEIKTLYEPDCKVQFLERTLGQVSGKEVQKAYYLITKN